MSTRRDDRAPAVSDRLSDVPRKKPHDAVPGDTVVEAAPGGERRRHNIVRLERSGGRGGELHLVFEPIPNATTYLTPDEVEREGRVVVENPSPAAND